MGVGKLRMRGGARWRGNLAFYRSLHLTASGLYGRLDSLTSYALAIALDKMGASVHLPRVSYSLRKPGSILRVSRPFHSYTASCLLFVDRVE